MKITISHYEFLQRFPNAEAARLYLEARRWSGTVVCPHCNKSERVQVRKATGYYRCLACKEDFTVRTGTIMERSHIPLDKWLHAMYLVATARKGVSSMQLSKELGITQKSAWFLLSRIREACGKGGPFGGQLCGVVEADETFIGGKEINKHADKKSPTFRGPAGKTPVLGMRERGGEMRGVVMYPGRHVAPQVRMNVKPGTVLCTDEAKAFKGLGAYRHLTVNHGMHQYVKGIASTNGIESVWAVLKRGYYGIYHHFSVKHMQRYVDEAAFRLNEGRCSVHTMDRIAALVTRSEGVRLTYKALTADA